MKNLFLIFLLLVPTFSFAQITVPQGGSGRQEFPQGVIIVGDTALRLTGTTSPSVGAIYATSTTATSTLKKTSISGPVNFLGEYITNFTTYVRSLFSASNPITYSGGVVGCVTADTTHSGCITSTDWNTFNGKGSVTSVGLSTPAFLSVTGSPVTSSGTLAISLSGSALPLANGGTGTTTSYSGGVVYSDGSKLTQSSISKGLFWDEVNKRLGVGTTTPQETLHVGGNFIISNPSSTKSYRFRTSGADLDFDFAGSNLYLSGYPNADFTGTQKFYMALDTSGNADIFGAIRFHDVPFAATKVFIDPPGAVQLVVTGNSTVSGLFGVGTTTPFAALSGVGTIPLAVSTSSVSGSNMPNFSIDKFGHEAHSGAKPTITVCGSSPSVTGSDNSGKITTGTAGPTSCKINFAFAYPTAPSCILTASQPDGLLNFSTVNASTTTSALTFMGVSTTTNSNVKMTSWVVMYHCEFNQ